LRLKKTPIHTKSNTGGHALARRRRRSFRLISVVKDIKNSGTGPFASMGKNGPLINADDSFLYRCSTFFTGPGIASR